MALTWPLERKGSTGKDVKTVQYLVTARAPGDARHRPHRRWTGPPFRHGRPQIRSPETLV